MINFKNLEQVIIDSRNSTDSVFKNAVIRCIVATQRDVDKDLDVYLESDGSLDAPVFKQLESEYQQVTRLLAIATHYVGR